MVPSELGLVATIHREKEKKRPLTTLPTAGEEGKGEKKSYLTLNLASGYNAWGPGFQGGLFPGGGRGCSMFRSSKKKKGFARYIFRTAGTR